MPISEVYNEHCEEGMKRYPDNFFDLAIVDPPYFDGPNKSGYYGKGFSNLGIRRHKDYGSCQSWDVPGKDYFTELKRVSRHQIIWGANHFAGVFDSSSSCWIVWDKVNGASSFADAELAYTSFETAVRVFRYMWNGMNQAKSIKEPDVMQGDKSKNEVRIHPTQKPVQLYRWLLHNYATMGMKILDTHMGSQSSRIAAYNMGFDFWGFEIDEEYFKKGNARFEDQTAQLSIF